MAYSACALISPVSLPNSRIYKIYVSLSASACSSSSNSPVVSVVTLTNRKATLKFASLSCTSRELPNLRSSDCGVSKSGKGCFHSVQYPEKRRSYRLYNVQAVSTGTAESTEADASEESASQLVDKLLSMVKDSDRGALLSAEAQGNVTGLVGELEKMGMPEPLKSPLVFGDWNVAYSSNPTSPGGNYRTWLGRLIFRTRDMIQSIVEPDGVVNVVRFALFGLIGGEVTLKGKLTPLDSKMIQVDFQPPYLRIGPAKFSYGGMSMVKISVIYLDQNIRLGRGSRGTIFVFTRR